MHTWPLTPTWLEGLDAPVDVQFTQRAKKVNSPGPVDFAIGVVIFVLKLPDRQVLFFGEIQITEGLQSILLIKKSFEASWNDLWASTTSYSLPEWQAVKLTFFATCYQNAKNLCFWCSESLDFPWETCPLPPTLLCTKKQFYPTKMQNLHAIILTN